MSIIRHIKELQNYSVYDATVSRGNYGQNTIKLGNPGLLQELIWTPPVLKLEIKYYIYGTNDILLNYDELHVWRIPSGDIDFNNSEIIKFNVTENKNKKEFTDFYKSGKKLLMLFSERIFINKKLNSWYTWNNDYTECTIKHNLNGYIDFIARYNKKELVYLQNKIIDNNTLLINTGDFFNKNTIQLLKSFTVVSAAEITLTNLIDFNLYNLNNKCLINVYKVVLEKQEQEYLGLEENLELVSSTLYEKIKNAKVKFTRNSVYRIYAITKLQDRDDYFELIVWKLDKSEDYSKINVFTYETYPASSCEWAYFENDLLYDLLIPYRFAFLGYIKLHNLEMPLTDKTGEEFLEDLQSFADTKTVSNEYSITKLFLYTLNNKKLKVLTPNLYEQNLANFIIIYSNCWALTYYCDMNKNTSYQTWVSTKNIYNESINVLTLTHTLNAIVKINVRDVREDMYETYIIDKNTIQINFIKHYKQNKTAFFVDLYAIWKDNI